MAGEADYYLPIIIEKRRWHICHLKREEGTTDNESGFSFIVDKNAETLFDIPKNAKFISAKKGFNDNKQIKGKLIPHISSENDNCASIDFTEKFEGNNENKAKLKINNGSVVVDKSNVKDVYKITIRFTNKANDKYSYTFNIHRVDKKSKNYIETAIDFGSEASQVSYKDGTFSNPTSLNLIEQLKNFFQDKNEDKELPFWQEDTSNHHLIRSIFFINKDSSNFKYAEKPLVNKEKSFFQILKKRTAVLDHYKDLFILPNLKLMEGMHNCDIDITLNIEEKQDQEKPPLATGDKLYDEKAAKVLLRLILSQFLYAILEKNKNIENESLYLSVTILVPNVYFQKNIYELIKGLYEDFKVITKDKEYSKFKGIEIKTISESDAAFLGSKSTQVKFNTFNEIPSQSNEYFLIIDAGKGTTDFSILKQSEYSTEFDCIYRSGIPLGGNYLTYAFFKSFEEELKECGIINLQDLLLKAERSHILDFLDILEKIKCEYSSTKNTSDLKISSEQLKNIKNKIKEYNYIEGIRELLKGNADIKIKLLDKNIEELVDLLKGEIDKSGISKFYRIVLTGRAFLFEPLLLKLKENLKDMLEDSNGFIFNNAQERYLKEFSVNGGLSLNNYRINNNSELVGHPIIISTECSKNKEILNSIEKEMAKYRWLKLLKILPQYEGFFIDGLTIPKNENYKIVISSRETLDYKKETEDCKLYFVGDGFIVQKKETSVPIELSYTAGDINKIKKSLFPFYDINEKATKQMQTVNNSESKNNEYINEQKFDLKIKELEKASGEQKKSNFIEIPLVQKIVESEMPQEPIENINEESEIESNEKEIEE